MVLELTDFVTLSPVPGFKEWIMESSLSVHKVFTHITSANENLQTISIVKNLSQLVDIIKDNTWIDNEELRDTLQLILMPMCAHYLVNEKYKGKQALNRVTNFHLRNGAYLEKINWLGNTSFMGMDQSCSIMVRIQLERYVIEY